MRRRGGEEARKYFDHVVIENATVPFKGDDNAWEIYINTEK